MKKELILEIGIVLINLPIVNCEIDAKNQAYQLMVFLPKTTVDFFQCNITYKSNVT